MEALKIDANNARKLYPTAAPEFKIMLEDTFGKPFFSQKITDRVKTFEDACALLDIAESFSIPNVEDCEETDQKGLIAAAKLFVIARALNEGWKPDWTDKSQYKYWPWFEYIPGSGFRYYAAYCNYSHSNVGSRLCFKSRELAEYAGKQFIDIYQPFLTIS